MIKSTDKGGAGRDVSRTYTMFSGMYRCFLYLEVVIKGQGQQAWLPGRSVVRNLPANAGDRGDVGSIPGLGRSLGEGNGNALQCSCLEKFRGQRRLLGHTVHGVTKSQTQLCEYAMPYHGSTAVWQMEVWVIRTERPADVAMSTINPCLTKDCSLVCSSFLVFQESITGPDVERLHLYQPS